MGRSSLRLLPGGAGSRRTSAPGTNTGERNAAERDEELLSLEAITRAIGVSDLPPGEKFRLTDQLAVWFSDARRAKAAAYGGVAP